MVLKLIRICVLILVDMNILFFFIDKYIFILNKETILLIYKDRPIYHNTVTDSDTIQ